MSRQARLRGVQPPCKDVTLNIFSIRLEDRLAAPSLSALGATVGARDTDTPGPLLPRGDSMW